MERMLLCLSAAEAWQAAAGPACGTGVSIGVPGRPVRLRQCWAVAGHGEGWHCQAELLCRWHPSLWKVPAVTQLCGPTERWLEGWKCNKIANNQAKNIADVVPCSAVLEY